MELFFGKTHNRSERAKQVEVLVPALNNKKIRYELLKRFGIDKLESDEARIFHFVWVLRDMYTFEREELKNETDWDSFINRWREILCLGEWALNKKLWIAEMGKNKVQGILHPCQKTYGWTEKNLKEKLIPQNQIQKLVEKRKVINTECDCFIQTTKRLIVIECKDSTSIKKEQKDRQKELILSLEKLFRRKLGVIYLELTNKRGTGDWTWEEINNYRK
jgi:hypothetical protein